MASSSIVSIVNLVKSGLLGDWSLGVPLRHLEYPDVVYLQILDYINWRKHAEHWYTCIYCSLLWWRLVASRSWCPYSMPYLTVPWVVFLKLLCCRILSQQQAKKRRQMGTAAAQPEWCPETLELMTVAGDTGRCKLTEYIKSLLTSSTLHLPIQDHHITCPFQRQRKAGGCA